MRPLPTPRCLLKKPSNSIYAPTVKGKMSDSTAVWDENRTETNQDALVKGCTVKAIVEISPVCVCACVCS